MNTRFSAHAYILVLLLQLLAPASMSLRAQQLTPPTISYEGQPVSSIVIAGRPDLNVRQLRQLIVQPVNAPYAQAKIDESIAALKNTGEANDVKLEVRPQSNGLEVMFVLQPALYFGMFDFGKASKVFSYTRLLQISNYPNQEPYNAARVEEAESALINFFHRTGYFLATIEPEFHTDTQHKVVNVLFHIDLKRKAKFGQIILTGTSPQETKHLADSLHSWGARLRGAYLKTGKPYSLKKLDTATTYLQGVLGKQHYLAGQVRLISANYDPRINRADITFEVTQGSQISINTQGAHVWGRTMKKLVPVYDENAADPDLVEEGARNLASYFQGKGYFDARVHSRIQKQPSDGTIIWYDIDKGSKGKVASVEFHGNRKFDDDDLASHVVVKKGGLFSHGKFSQQLLRKSVKNLENVYKNAGYSHVSVTPSVVNKNGKLSIAFQVVEGVQDVVETLKIEGNQTLPENEFAPKGLNLTPGRPFSEQLLEKDRNQIMAVYLNKGYLTANFKATTKPLKNDPHKVEVIYTIYEGPQVHAVSVAQLGVQHTRPEIIAKNARIPTGQPLSETQLLESESKLYTLGIFDWASVDPLRPVTDDPNEEVLIKVHEASRNNITYGFGFEVINRGGSVPGGTVALPNLPPVGLPSSFTTSQKTFWGPRGSIEYTRSNFRGRAETLTIGALGARLDQRGAITWSNPSFWDSIWSTTLTLTGEHSSENPIFTSQLVQAGYQFQRPLDAKKTQTLFLRYTFRRTDLSNVLIPDLVTPQDQHERLSTLSASYSRDTRDHALDAHRGIYESFDVSLNPSFLGSNTNFVRLLGQTAYYRPIGGNHIVWANSVRLGIEEAFAGAQVPLSELFFSGGGSTLRGFPLNGAGPQRDVAVCSNPADSTTCSKIRVPVGGTQLVVLNSEVRFPLPIPLPLINSDNLGGAVFYDGGNVFQSVGFGSFLDQYTNTLGFGLRYATPIGPVRFDIGHNMNPISGVKATQIFITLGQAF